MTTQHNEATNELLRAFPETYNAYIYALANPAISVAPPAEQLASYWTSEYDVSAEMTKVKDVYGVLRSSGTENPWAVASVDLCDVTRQTAKGIMRLGGFTVDHIGEKYSYGTPFGLDDDPDAIVSMVQTVMVRDSIEPVDGIEDIQEILSTARENGVYVVANTSTLEGCELATIDWIAQYLPGCFDGIVLPRNHDGSGAVTKGTAKEAVLASLTTLTHPERVESTIHIDDAPHHIHAVRKTAQNLKLKHYADFTPIYNWNSADKELNHQATPLESFIAANGILNAWKQR